MKPKTPIVRFGVLRYLFLLRSEIVYTTPYTDTEIRQEEGGFVERPRRRKLQNWNRPDRRKAPNWNR